MPCGSGDQISDENMCTDHTNISPAMFDFNIIIDFRWPSWELLYRKNSV